jgi:hypothetical protein
MKRNMFFGGLLVVMALLLCCVLVAAATEPVVITADPRQPKTPLRCYGACCLEDGECAWMTPSQCEAVGGTFIGEGVPCDPNPCEQQPEQGCMSVEIGDHFCLQFEEAGDEIDVCWCCPEEGPPVFTYVPGCDPSNTSCDDTTCVAYTGQLFWTTAVFVPNDTVCGPLGGFWTTTFFTDGVGCVCVSFDYQLPVELTAEPTLTPGDREMTLRFYVADEQDVTHYEILRDGAKVAELEVADGSYTYVDRNLMNDRRYEYSIWAVELGARKQLSYAGQAVWAGAPSANHGVVTEYALHQNHPNPFNPETTISYDLMEAGFVSLKIYDLLGREVATLVSSEKAAGRQTVVFSAQDLPSGVYICSLSVNDYTAVRKMVLLK